MPQHNINLLPLNWRADIVESIAHASTVTVKLNPFNLTVIYDQTPFNLSFVASLIQEKL